MTKTLSRKGLEPDIVIVGIEPEDRIIITSDRIHDYTLAPEMERILQEPANREAAKAAEALVKFAKKDEHRAPRDDATAIVVNIQ
jgi:serine/threonine protein phosphatase PrpC